MMRHNNNENRRRFKAADATSDNVPHPQRPRTKWATSLVILALLITTSLYIWNTFFRYKVYGVVSGQVVKVATFTPGTVQQIHVGIGDLVCQDQLLVSLKFPELEKRLASITDELVVARADFRTEMSLPEEQRDSRPKIAKVNVLENEAARIAQLMECSQMRTPVAGRIVRLDCLPGELAQSTVPILHILENNSLEAVLYVSQSAVPDMDIGQTMTISIDAADSSFRCRIERIAPELQTAPAAIAKYYPKDSKLVEVHALILSDHAAANIPLGSTVRFLALGHSDPMAREEEATLKPKKQTLCKRTPTIAGAGRHPRCSDSRPLDSWRSWCPPT